MVNQILWNAETTLSQKTGNNFCILPWISIDRNNDLKDHAVLGPCCMFEPKHEQTDIVQYWTSDELDAVRKDFLRDQRPEQCRKCWKSEDAGIKSLRQSVNEQRKEQYVDSIDNPKPRQVKYDVGHECNLACRMCLPHLSSGVTKVWTALERNDIHKVQPIDTFDYIMDNAETIDYIDIIGGEPFFHKKTKKLLQSLIDTGNNSHIKIFTVTNATRIDEQTVALLKKFKDATLSISLDATGELQEYIRPGSSWNTIDANLKLLEQNNISFQITPCISVINILHMKDLEQWCRYRGYTMAQPTIIEQPCEMAPHNLPYQLHRFVHDDYKSLIDKKQIDSDSLNFLRDLDLYWNTDITAVSPLWKTVFEELHWKNFDQLKSIDKEMRQYADPRTDI